MYTLNLNVCYPSDIYLLLQAVLYFVSYRLQFCYAGSGVQARDTEK